MEKHFNLIDEAWIPITDRGRASLRQVFSDPTLRALGGNPVQKIALMKLLLAIAQAAATPEDDEAWRAMGADGMAEKCLAYLDHWHDWFDLYGERPFLQMPTIAAAEIKSYGTVLPEIATGNTTVLTHGQVERVLGDAEKAVLLVCLMGFALGGKKTDNKVVLTPGYAGKKNKKGTGPGPGLPGASIHDYGLLHSMLLGDGLLESLWLNLLTSERIAQNTRFPAGLGTAPWEHMPAGEDDDTARQLKQSVMGRLVPLCRFCLLADGGLHYSEGIAHDNYKEGICDPTIAVNWAGKKALWTNPEKRPWRELTALLGFLAQQQSTGFECWQLAAGVDRACDAVGAFCVWSGGMRVHKHATGEQYASGTDDFVESQVSLQSSALGDFWFAHLQAEMLALDGVDGDLMRCIKRYFRRETASSKDDELGKATGRTATHLFWQLCERDFQSLLDACDPDDANTAKRQRLRRRFSGYAQQAYDQFCPKDTARQLDAWARCRPNLSTYLQPEA